MIDLQKLNIKNKIKLFKKLYEEISGKGIQGDTELAILIVKKLNY